MWDCTKNEKNEGNVFPLFLRSNVRWLCANTFWAGLVCLGLLYIGSTSAPVAAQLVDVVGADLKIPGGGGAANVAAESGIELKGVRFTGNHVFSDEELTAVIQAYFGRRLNFSDLEAMAAAVTRYYRDAGYIGSQAYLPPQQIDDSIVEIAIIEGRYGVVDMRNHSRLLDSLAEEYVAGLTSGTLIQVEGLEARMASLSFLSGVRANSTLVPGSEPGTADVIVDLHDEPRFSGTIEIDNTGSRYVGQPRAGLTLITNNFAGYGGRVILRATSGGGPEFFHRHIAYEGPMPLAGPEHIWPGEISITYNDVRYKLVDAFSVLDAGGRASTLSTALEIPLSVYHTPRGNARLSAHLDYSLKHLEDHQGSTVSATREIHLFSGGIVYIRQGVYEPQTFAERLLTVLSHGAVQSRFQATLTTGRLVLNSPVAQLIDDLTAKSSGRFYKVNARFSASWLYRDSEIYGSVAAQWGSKNLDTSEKMSLGGFEGVRAYPSGDSSGDDSIVASLEIKRLLFAGKPNTTWADGRLQGTVFADVGVARLYKNPWGIGTSSANERRIAGIGVGINWSQGAFALSVQHGWRLGSQTATADTDTGGRLWMNASYRY